MPKAFAISKIAIVCWNNERAPSLPIASHLQERDAMIAVTDADRKAAADLRARLADLSGFWHRLDDEGPLCIAMAMHREQCELQLLEKMSATIVRSPVVDTPSAMQPAMTRTNRRPSVLAAG